MNKLITSLLILLTIPFAFAQISQPPGGITGNLPGWTGGNGTTGQVLTSRGPTTTPTFQAAASGGTPGGTTTQLQYNNAGAFGGTTTTYNSTTGGLVLPTGGSTSAATLQFGTNATGNWGNSSAYHVVVGGADKITINSSGSQAVLSGGIVAAGTKFTAVGTGCTVGATVGGGTAGTFTLATGPCTSVAVTMGGASAYTATNGWVCQAHDRTSAVTLIGGESASTTGTATFTIPAGAGTADVISFSCIGF